LKNKIQKTLPKIEPLPGAVCLQTVRCGKPDCKCAKGELHGGYYYHFYYVRGKLHKKCVKKADVMQTKAACLAYKTNRQEIRQLIRESLNNRRSLKRMLKEVGL
jgi:hypothetical protein